MDLRFNNFILDEIEKYMIYDINIIKQDENNNINKSKLNKIFEVKKNHFNSNKDFNSNKGIKLANEFKSNLFIPKNNDKLFWCLYILKYGFNEYNLNFNYGFSIEKELKINGVTFMKDNKHSLKIKKTQVESNLLYDKQISIQSAGLLCSMFDLNIRIINNNFYYEFLNIDKEDFKNIIYENKNYGINLDYEIYNIEDKYLITNICKPINAISFYKLDELIKLANKLKVNIKNENNKNKTKKEIYEIILTIISK